MAGCGIICYEILVLFEEAPLFSSHCGSLKVEWNRNNYTSKNLHFLIFLFNSNLMDLLGQFLCFWIILLHYLFSCFEVIGDFVLSDSPSVEGEINLIAEKHRDFIRLECFLSSVYLDLIFLEMLEGYGVRLLHKQRNLLWEGTRFSLRRRAGSPRTF